MRKILFILAAVLLGSIGLHASNTITYNALAKLSGAQFNVGATTFGSSIISHDFSNGVGTIVCNGPITKIGESAFGGRSDLTSIEIPNSVTRIEGYAFDACNKMTSVKIPSSVTLIGPFAFWGCESLKSVEIPNSVVEIANRAFCVSGLTSVEIPKSVKSLGINAFYGCKGMTSVKVNWTDAASIVPIDTIMFENIAKEAGPKGAKLYVPTGTYGLYKGTKGWKEFGCIVDLDNKITYTASAQIDSERLNVGATTFGFPIFSHDFSNGIGTIICTGPITKVGDYAFQGCSALGSVTIPNTVTQIGTSAFEGCSGLTSVTIPASVKQIADWAFKNCTSLKDLNFADRTDAINIGTYAFENMAVENVAIPDWMAVIPEGLFYNNKKLKGIYLHEGVREIGNRPFGECPFEYIISMAQTPPTLIGQAFEGHDKDANVIVYVPTSDAVAAYKNSDWNKYFTNFITELEYRIISSADRTAEVIKAIPIDGRVEIPAVVTLKDTLYNVAGIGSGAIKDQTELQHLILPPTMKYIGDNALEGCTNLKNVKLPIELQTIGASAFYGCSALDSIAIPEGVQSIGKSAFKGCSKLTRVSLPAGLKNIPDECFRQCPLGQEIIIPEGVETIGEYAFEGNSETRMDAESITLPSTLKEINQGAFFLHDGLKGVTCLATTPPALKGQAFAEYQYQKYKEEHITVYVPNRDVVAAYRDDKNQWGSDIYQFKFSDLMAEANKEYLHTLAGDNDTAKVIANAYCDSIDNRATTTQQVQDYTNTAAMMMDKYVFPDYKKRLCDALDSIAAAVLDAQPIADEYKPRIMDTHFRGEAENLFAEGCAKIDALKQLQDLKRTCGNALRDMAQDNKNAKLMADTYAELIDGAATQAEVYQLYEEGKKRVAQILFLEEYWTELPDGCRVLGGFIEE